MKADSQRSYFKLLFRQEMPWGVRGRKDVKEIKALAGWIGARRQPSDFSIVLTLTVFEVQSLAVQSVATK